MCFASQGTRRKNFPMLIDLALNVLHHQSTSLKYCYIKASRKFKEYKRFRYFVRYFCTQKNVGKSSKSWKMNKKSAGTINAFDNVACKYPATKIYIEENLKQNT